MCNCSFPAGFFSMAIVRPSALVGESSQDSFRAIEAKRGFKQRLGPRVGRTTVTTVSPKSTFPRTLILYTG